ncbi:MAG: type II toxin-antitoxin system RelE/ParE family toxin [Candidatus Heimdallarchaeota archaeon]
MGYQIFFHPKAHSALEKLNSSLYEQIVNKIRELKNNPEIGTHLKYAKFWRLKVQDYRVIYEIQAAEKKVIILYIGHRKNVYDKFSKLI